MKQVRKILKMVRAQRHWASHDGFPSVTVTNIYSINFLFRH